MAERRRPNWRQETKQSSGPKHHWLHSGESAGWPERSGPRKRAVRIPAGWPTMDAATFAGPVPRQSGEPIMLSVLFPLSVRGEPARCEAAHFRGATGRTCRPHERGPMKAEIGKHLDVRQAAEGPKNDLQTAAGYGCWRRTKVVRCWRRIRPAANETLVARSSF
jgi:hypothetical protein